MPEVHDMGPFASRLARGGLLPPLALACTVTIAAPCLAQPPQAPEASEREHAYVIGPEDVLEIAVWNNTAVSRTVPVRPDGMISLPLLHDVRADGLTPMQLREVLVKGLERYISVPEVSVIVREVNSFKVSVIGEVATPGRFELRSRATVLDVLALAGGLSEYANGARIVVLRRNGMEISQIPFDYGRVTSTNGATHRAENLVVQAGDVIVVP